MTHKPIINTVFLLKLSALSINDDCYYEKVTFSARVITHVPKQILTTDNSDENHLCLIAR